MPNNRTNILWANKIKSILNNLGYSYIFNNFDSNIDYLPSLKQRLRDQFVQNWRETTMNMSKLDYYCKFKTFFKFEEYLTLVTNDKLRKHLSCFRLCSHNLAIEAGRFVGIDRQNRICEFCNNNTVESEYHFLLTCPKYHNIRNTYLPRIFWPSINKFVKIMSATNRYMLVKLSKYIDEAFKLRNQP